MLSRHPYARLPTRPRRASPSLLHQRRQCAEADLLYAEAAEAITRSLGTEHPLLVLGDWAETKDATGELSAPIEMQERAVAILEAGDGDPAALGEARTKLAALRTAPAGRPSTIPKLPM